MTTRRTRTSVKLQLHLAIIARMVFVTQGWKPEDVYHGCHFDPELDEHLIIALLEEFRDIWKPAQDATHDTDPGVPPEEAR